MTPETAAAPYGYPAWLRITHYFNFLLHHQPPDEMDPYERLLGDAANGDATLFAREDSVEAAWRVVDSVLGNTTPLFHYEPNTRGTPQMARALVPEGGWHNPKPKEVSL